MAQSLQLRLNLLCGLLFAMGLAGCNSSSTNPAVDEQAATSSSKSDTQTPLHKMRYSVLNGRWDAAWTHADAVLQENGQDAETVAFVAQVAHANGHPDQAAELLVKACELEEYASEERVLQATIALVSVGKFYDGMPMLEAALAKQPQQHETRRTLFDFYIGTENRPKALPHGRYLIRNRAFDVELMLSIGNTETRSLTSDPLKEISKRNPDDKRPMIGDAKVAFDKGKIDEAIEMLDEVLNSHPKFLPAQALLCFAYAAAGRFDDLTSFTETKASDEIDSFAIYWLAWGDAARDRDDYGEAARAYWEATKRDGAYAEAWLKLASSLPKAKSSGLEITNEQQAAVERRAENWASFNTKRYRFDRSGKASREIAIEVAESLRDLGRLWEAEAWASLALTLPEDESVPATKVRRSIVKQLVPDSPWQMAANYPELSLDLSGLSLSRVTAQKMKSSPQLSSMGGPESQTVDPVTYQLTNEAESRGLTFFGRTHDKLAEPGIMLHRTLGCGGGTIDFDLDGWPDLYLVTAGGTPATKDSDANALVRNIDGMFRDATVESETGDCGFGQGASIGDVNEDGFPDVLVLNYGRNALFINNGDGTFRDVSDTWFDKEDGNNWSTCAAIADMDDDSIADLMIVNYCEGLEPSTEVCQTPGTDSIRSCSPIRFRGAPDGFYKGTASGGFRNQTALWKGQPDELGRGLGVVAGNFDDKQGLDWFVANDMTNNHFWSLLADTDDAGKLAESAMLRGVGADDRALALGSMGIATGDFDRDGDIDFYVTNFNQECNTYHDNRGGGIWQDITKRVGLNAPTRPMVGFGTEAIDLDNDGQLELIISNGNVDVFTRDDKLSIYEQPMQVFRRRSDGRYDSVGETMKGQYLESHHVGRALWTIDADRDGLLDLVVTHQTEPVALLMNRSQQKGSCITLALYPTRSSRNAAGTKVEVTDTATNQTWTAFVTSGDGYLCSNEKLTRVGVGAAVTRVDVKITWPSGDTNTIAQLECEKDWSITEGSNQAFAQELQ